MSTKWILKIQKINEETIIKVKKTWEGFEVPKFQTQILWPKVDILFYWIYFNKLWKILTNFERKITLNSIQPFLPNFFLCFPCFLIIAMINVNFLKKQTNTNKHVV